MRAHAAYRAQAALHQSRRSVIKATRSAGSHKSGGSRWILAPRLHRLHRQPPRLNSYPGLTDDDVEAISAYSDPGNYQRINSNFYQKRETQLNFRLRAALSKCVIPDGVIAWRGAGFKLYRYPEQGPRIFRGGPQKAIGRVFDHRPPVSTSVGNGPVTIGQRQPVWYKLRIDPGVRGVFIPEIAVKGHQERELLLAPATRIRIDRATLVGDRWYVLATALDPCSPTDA